MLRGTSHYIHLHSISTPHIAPHLVLVLVDLGLDLTTTISAEFQFACQHRPTLSRKLRLLFPELALPVLACELGVYSAPVGIGPLPCPATAELSVLGASLAAVELAGLSNVPCPTAANSSLTDLCGSELAVVWSRPPTAPVSVPGARVAVLVEVE